MDAAVSKPQSMPLGFFYMVLTSLSLAAMGTFGKLAQDTLSVYQVAFLQNVVALICIIPIVGIRRRGFRGLGTRHLGLHLVRDFAGTIGFLLFFSTLPYISLVDAVLLNNAGPLFVPFIVWVWLKHKAPGRLYIGTVLGFVGVLLILQPGKGGFHPAMILALLSGFTMAITFVSIRVLNKTEGPFVILLYYFVVASICTLPLAVWKWEPFSSLDLLYTVVVGLSMLAFQVCMILAFQRGLATVLAPLVYLTVVWSGIIDWLVWGQVPNWVSVAGVLLVILGGVLSLLLGHRIQKAADASPYPKEKPR